MTETIISKNFDLSPCILSRISTAVDILYNIYCGSMRIDSTGWIPSEYIYCVDGLSVGFAVYVCCTQSSSPSPVRLKLVLLAQSAAGSFWNALAPKTSPRARLRWRLSQFFCAVNKINTADLWIVAFRRHKPLRISSQEREGPPPGFEWCSDLL